MHTSSGLKSTLMSLIQINKCLDIHYRFDVSTMQQSIKPKIRNSPMSIEQVETFKTASGEETVNPVKQYIQDSLRLGVPAKIEFSLSGLVNWRMGPVWLESLNFKVLPPYSLPDPDNQDLDEATHHMWDYATKVLDTIEPVPYENLADYKHLVPVAANLLETLRTQIKENPYQSMFTLSRDGILVTATLTFKP